MKMTAYLKEIWKKWRAPIIIGIVIIMLPSLIFAYHVGFKPSTKPDDWGAFGSFLGGLWGPILSLLNVVAIIILQISFSKYQEKQVDQQRKYEALKSSIERIEKSFEQILDAYSDKSNTNRISKINDYGSRIGIQFENLKSAYFVKHILANNEAIFNSPITTLESFINTPNSNTLQNLDTAKEELINKLYELI